MTAESTVGSSTSVPPRVFISYARSDGEDFAKELRQRLQAEGIPLWQDRIGMEGGQDWWLQIVEALDQVEFMVLVMSPAALRSEIVRKEWRYARQQGVCVFPVKGVADLQISSLPHWMRSVHFYDLNYEWQKFLNDLNTRCQQPRVPFMVEDLPPDFVPRPYEFEALIDKLLDENREEPIAITAALRGAGGYGKTTIVKALCYDERMQQAFDDGILWVMLGENPGNLVGKVEDLIYMLNKERPGFSSIDTASARLAELLADRDILLVIDDVWDAAHLRPFLQGGKRCARLITTRNEDVLPANTQTLRVDAMRPQEAVQLLSASLGHKIQAASDKQALRDLAQQLGEWPLLLKLANGVLQERVHQGEPLLNALAYLKKALAKRGLTAFDARNPSSRNSAVSATLRVSFELLTGNDYARYKELAIFPEDIDIPLVTLQRLWRKTGGMDDIDTEELCRYLYQHSMLLRFDLATRSIRLHDVIRGYLEYEARKELTVIHGQLLDGYQVTRWSMLPDDEPYLWDHLAEHLIAAGRINELLATLQDGTYLTRKVWLRNASGIEIDITRAMKEVPSDIILPLLKQCIRQMSHLLNQCKTPKEVTATLHRAFSPQPDLSVVCTSLEKELSRPFLTSWHPFPSLINAHLLRILIGHAGWVNECAVSPNGNFIVSTSGDQTLKVWDAHTGVAQFTLRGHTDVVNGCAVSPDSNIIVSTAGDQTLKVWDANTGMERLTLKGHTDRINGCTVSPDGNTIISASSDGTLKLWDAHTGEGRMTFRGHTDRVNGCRVSPDGNTIVSVSHDQTLKVWDAHTGIVQFTLKGHTGAVYVGVVSPDGNTIVSSSHDQTLKVWDAHTGLERLSLLGHTGAVYGCAMSPDGSTIVSASDDRTLRLWDVHTGAERFMLTGHSDAVNGCAVSPDGSTIVSASDDRTLRLWDARTDVEQFTSNGHTDWVYGCAVSPDGNTIVSASDDRTLKLWHARTGTERLTLRGHTDWVRGCTMSPDGNTIVSASWDGTLKVWDAHTGVERLTLKGHTDRVSGCAVSPDGNTIISASDDRTLKLWDIHTGMERLTLRGHTDWVRGCAISSDGNTIVSASWDGTLKLWDAHTGEERLTLRGHTDGVNGCAVSPDGNTIVSASHDQTLKLWDAHTGAERLTFRGHTDAAYGCAISPNGDYLFSASDDQTLKLWDMLTGVCLDELAADGYFFGCAFSFDGVHLAAVGRQGVFFLQLLR